MHPYRRVSAYRIASKKVLDFGGGGGVGVEVIFCNLINRETNDTT